MKLGEITRESRETYSGDKTGIPIVGLEHLVSQELKFTDYDIDTDNTFTKKFHKGQILFGRRRAYLKKAAIADFDGICSGDITVIEAIPGKVDPMLLPFIIQNDRLFDYAISHSAGGLSPRVKWADLADYEFDLPSLEEQRRLADKLWAAYELKEAYKKMIAATDEMVKAQFIEMFKSCQYITLESLSQIWLKGQLFKKDCINNAGRHKCIHYGELFTKYNAIIKNVISRTDAEITMPSCKGDILFPASDVTPNGLARCSMINESGVLLGGDIINPLAELSHRILDSANRLFVFVVHVL